ncbi:MAG TPA: hypothetical protein VNY36_01495, partial [Bacteroidia bacterium]|nr:hypothetical protein [Bacteroidia bacterium]
MYRITYVALLFLLPLGLMAQDHLAPLHGNPVALHAAAKEQLNRSTRHTTSAGMDTIPFLDDFSKPGPYPDANKWLDKKVYVNFGNPVCPHTLGVATFDGLDSIGKPYNPAASSGSSAPADVLTSLPFHWNIFFSGETMATKLGDSIKLSFYYQAGTYFGNDPQGKSSLGYWPKESDTLLLQFRAGGDSNWHTKWYHLGSEPVADTDTVFHMVMIPFTIADTSYLRDGFQFRFMNYACGSADADHWSVDEVYINQNRLLTDTVQNDIAFAYEAPSMLTSYTAEPWEQYQRSDLRSTPMRLFERNNQASAKIVSTNEINTTYNYSINTPSINVYTGGAHNVWPFIDSGYNSSPLQTLVPITPGNFPATLTGPATYTITHSLSNIGDFDAWNDTLRYDQVFSDYYAYDDGSPEAAYYVQGFGTLPTYLAYQFKFNNPDTIMGLRIYFDYLFVNSANYTFKMIVWNDNGGSPGDTIYVDTLRNPTYNFTGNDLYTGYFFKKNVPVKAGTYYVGWELTTGDSINVGFDYNNHNGNKIFYCINPFATNLTWYNSTYDGSLMVRPIMASPTLVAGVNNIDAQPTNEITLYPNPAKNEVMLSGNLH